MKANRYARKRRHKRELEKKYAKKYAYGSGQYDVQWLREKLRREAQEDNWWIRKHPPIMVGSTGGHITCPAGADMQRNIQTNVSGRSTGK